MSLPTARQSPDDTSPSQRNGGQAVVSGAVPAAAAAQRDQDPMIGRVLDGRFTIEARLGAGSMGTVYRAKQHAMGRDVAIKILRSDRALDESSRARFLREARANSLLASAHTVTVFDFGQADNGDFFLAMELLDGESLGARLQREKRLAPDKAVDCARQALRSLAEAHAKGIIHRDLKPDNLFFARQAKTDEAGVRQHEELVKVLDFGIAKMLSAENAEMNAVETQAGTVFGTPRYMSPEQAQGKPLDSRSDLYSLGVILYHMLTGRPPFTDDDAIVVMARHIKTPPKRPIEACPQANIPVEVENVLLRVLSKEPTQRPPSAEAFSQELARAMSLSATATSGVRISLPGSTIPPPSASAPVPPSIPPPPALPAMGAPGAPASAAKAPPDPESLTALPSSSSSTDSVQIAAGLRPSRGKRVMVVAIASMLVAGAAAAFVLGRSTSAPRPALELSRPPATEPAIPPPPTTAAAATVATTVAIPSASSNIPSTTFAALPRAPEPTSAPPAPRPRPSPPHATKPAAPRPTATTTASGHYGLFE